MFFNICFKVSFILFLINKYYKIKQYSLFMLSFMKLRYIRQRKKIVGTLNKHIVFNVHFIKRRSCSTSIIFYNLTSSPLGQNNFSLWQTGPRKDEMSFPVDLTDEWQSVKIFAEDRSWWPQTQSINRWQNTLNDWVTHSNEKTSEGHITSRHVLYEMWLQVRFFNISAVPMQKTLFLL